LIIAIKHRALDDQLSLSDLVELALRNYIAKGAFHDGSIEI
jgi:hypothetical protein